jgi:hypothetical protein
MLLPDTPDAADEADALIRHVRSWVRLCFARATVTDRFHGLDHAHEVERNVLAVMHRIESALTVTERAAVQCAALLHDVGYCALVPTWSRDRREHVVAGVATAFEVLATVPWPSESESFTTVVGYLIAHHDDTNFRHPSRAWGGRVRPLQLGQYTRPLARFASGLPASERARLLLLLDIVREADGLAGSGRAGAERTFQYSVARGLPVWAPGNPLTAWCWEDSAIGNVRLAGKRALIDATTLDGHRIALERVHDAEEFIAQTCLEHGIAYQAETKSDCTKMPNGALARHDLRILRYASWKAATRHITKMDAHMAALPHMVTRQFAVSRLPATQGRALDSAQRGLELSGLRLLHALLLRDYALNLFDLTGVLEFKLDGIRYRMTPPVVVRVRASSAPHDEVAIIDGKRRLALARALDVPTLWAVEIW